MELKTWGSRPSRARFGIVAGALLAAAPLSCKDSEPPGSAANRPNVLWVVWDTVRADHLSVYGYEKPTTPRLEEWAKGARVYDNCTSPASSTVPSHASMFTGLLPSEHGTHAGHRFLNDEYTTIAELLRAGGYQTFLYSANPHICAEENFHQGFDAAEHPWSPRYRDEALRIVRSKIPPQDRSSELPRKIHALRAGPWHIKAAGELAQRATLEWLKQRDLARPFFIFLNYMEAHRPFIPPESYRHRMMTPEQVALSYQVDRSWLPMWSYTFRQHEYTAEQIETMAATYDATLAELDDLLHDLLAALESIGGLDDTIIILTSDHGEHLGEHHMLDHQYSLYNPLVHVPLIVHYPRQFPAGRDSRPVVNFDLFPTLLELAGIEPPAGLRTRAVSLLAPHEQRIRLAEYPAVFEAPFRAVRQVHPSWEPTPWRRTLRALVSGELKYIWASDGRHELYNIREDPLELHNLIHRTQIAQPLAARLADYVATLARPVKPAKPPPPLTREQLERLAALGYIDLPEEQENTETPATSQSAGDP